MAAFAPLRRWHPLDRLLARLGRRGFNLAILEAFRTGRTRFALPFARPVSDPGPRPRHAGLPRRELLPAAPPGVPPPPRALPLPRGLPPRPGRLRAHRHGLGGAPRGARRRAARGRRRRRPADADRERDRHRPTTPARSPSSDGTSRRSTPRGARGSTSGATSTGASPTPTSGCTGCTSASASTASTGGPSSASRPRPPRTTPRWCASAARRSPSLNRRRIRSQPAPAILAAVNAETTESSGRPLLCDFHIHTRFSDGLLDLAAVVDLFGQAGFDAISITDHVATRRPRSAGSRGGCGSRSPSAPSTNYLAQVRAEAARALETYGMLVIPGVEITKDYLDSDLSAHLLLIDIQEFVSGLLELRADLRGRARPGRPGDRLPPAPHVGALRPRHPVPLEQPRALRAPHRRLGDRQPRRRLRRGRPEEVPLRGEQRLPPAAPPLLLEDAAVVRAHAPARSSAACARTGASPSPCSGTDNRREERHGSDVHDRGRGRRSRDRRARCSREWRCAPRCVRRVPATAVDEQRWPPVSILKPLAGLDDNLFGNLESFCRLDYPAYEIIFCLASPNDPAHAIARKVRARNPRPADLHPRFHALREGHNPKVRNMLAGYRGARHDVAARQRQQRRGRPVVPQGDRAPAPRSRASASSPTRSAAAAAAASVRSSRTCT